MSRRARAYLIALARESNDIDDQLRTLDNFRDRLKGFTSNLSHDNAQSVHKPHNDRIGAYTAYVVDLERLLEERIERYSLKRSKVTEIFLQMTDRNGSLLHLRYIDCEPWSSVADALGISVTWAYTLHNRALKEFENLFYN